MMKIKFYVLNLLFALPVLSYSQEIKAVGINTDNPTHTLDVNGDARIRTLPKQNVSKILSADNQGVVGVTTGYELTDMASIVASGPVNASITSTEYFDATIVRDIELGLSLDVVIPANKKGIVIIDYSVPVGKLYNSTEGEPLSYSGITFLKKTNNGAFAEEYAGSRKYSVTEMENSAANVLSVSNVFIEEIDNTNSNTDLNITYKLDGYLEQSYKDATRDFRFNMWSATGDNKNWGKATMSKTVYLK